MLPLGVFPAISQFNLTLLEVMSAHERGRYLVLLAMTATFLAIVGLSFVKYRVVHLVR